MTENRNIWGHAGLTASFDTTFSLATPYQQVQTLIYRLPAVTDGILSDHQRQKVTMRRYVKSDFDQALALSGKWTPHPNPAYREHRLELRVERNSWQARLTNPIEANRYKRPYIVRSLTCKPNELETALAKAAIFHKEIINPIIAGPTFASVLPEYIETGMVCKVARGGKLGTRAPANQIAMTKLLTRAVKVIGDTPLDSDVWEDVFTGAAMAEEFGTDDTLRKVTQAIKGTLFWAKKVKKLKVGELPAAAPNLMTMRAGLEDEVEYERILREAGDDEWFRQYMRFVRHSGLRPGQKVDMSGVRFRDVGTTLNIEGWVPVHVTKPKHGTPVRVAQADIELLDVMAKIRAIHPTPNDPDALVFPGTDYGRIFKELIDRLQAREPSYPWCQDAEGRGRKLYSLRHYHLSLRSILPGWHLQRLSEHGGNTDAVMGYYYVKKNKKRIQAAVPINPAAAAWRAQHQEDAD